MGHEMGVGELTETPDKKPLFECLTLRSFDSKVDGQAEERVSEAIVCSGLSGNDVS
jgi:hypothetical protein